jgi:hypothetical protein
MAWQTPPGAKPNRDGIWDPPPGRPGWLLERRSNASPRGMVAQGVSKETWSIWTEPGLQTLWHFSFTLRSRQGLHPKTIVFSIAQ